MDELSQRRRRLVARLRSSRSRIREARVLVEGVRAVGEALSAGVVPDFALISDRLDRVTGGAGLRERLEGSGAELLTVDDGTLEELADTEAPQGVLMVCPQPDDRLLPVATPGRWLVVDAIQDPGNLGTLVRSAVAFGFDGVVCLDGTVDPWGSKAVRASAGMIFRLPVFRCTVQEAVSVFAEAGLPLLVASAEGAVTVRDRPAFALVVGNEGSGPRSAVREAASETLAIRMRGPAESLNAGIAGSILMYQLSGEGS